MLGVVLFALDEKQWRPKVIDHRRNYVEGEVRDVVCEFDLTTGKRGTLIATKNRASYEPRARQHRADTAGSENPVPGDGAARGSPHKSPI
jgi:hypothetical protein